MLLTANSHTETNCPLENKEFKIKKSSVVFDILSSKLYSDKKFAVVRELLSNAYESQMKNGNPDTYIDISLPTAMEDNFIIRDYGTGLTKDEVFTLYSTFFESTKSNTNDFTGCFGLGSKTPFAIVDSFVVTSYVDGIASYYYVNKNNGVPSIMHVSSVPLDVPNGLQITVSISNKEDKADIASAVSTYLTFMPEIKVNVLIGSIHVIKPVVENDNFAVYAIAHKTPMSDLYQANTDRVLIKQGQTICNVDKEKIDCSLFNCFVSNIHTFIVKKVSIGTLDVLPNREAFAENDAYKKECSMFTSEFRLNIDDLLTRMKEKYTDIAVDECHKTVYKKLINILIPGDTSISFIANRLTLHFDYHYYIYKSMLVNHDEASGKLLIVAASLPSRYKTDEEYQKKKILLDKAYNILKKYPLGASFSCILDNNPSIIASINAISKYIDPIEIISVDELYKRAKEEKPKKIEKVVKPKITKSFPISCDSYRYPIGTHVRHNVTKDKTAEYVVLDTGAPKENILVTHTDSDTLEPCDIATLLVAKDTTTGERPLIKALLPKFNPEYELVVLLVAKSNLKYFKNIATIYTETELKACAKSVFKNIFINYSSNATKFREKYLYFAYTKIPTILPPLLKEKYINSVLYKAICKGYTLTENYNSYSLYDVTLLYNAIKHYEIPYTESCFDKIWDDLKLDGFFEELYTTGGWNGHMQPSNTLINKSIEVVYSYLNKH